MLESVIPKDLRKDINTETKLMVPAVVRIKKKTQKEEIILREH
jgi:hypothetical protein